MHRTSRRRRRVRTWKRTQRWRCSVALPVIRPRMCSGAAKDVQSRRTTGATWCWRSSRPVFPRSTSSQRDRTKTTASSSAWPRMVSVNLRPQTPSSWSTPKDKARELVLFCFRVHQNASDGRALRGSTAGTYHHTSFSHASNWNWFRAELLAQVYTWNWKRPLKEFAREWL